MYVTSSDNNKIYVQIIVSKVRVIKNPIIKEEAVQCHCTSPFKFYSILFSCFKSKTTQGKRLKAAPTKCKNFKISIRRQLRNMSSKYRARTNVNSNVMKIRIIWIIWVASNKIHKMYKLTIWYDWCRRRWFNGWF